MYSEIQAVVGFLSNFLYNKLPRRKVNLLAEQLANFLAQKFSTCWYPAEPQRKANMRCIRVNVDSQMDPLISVAVSCVGLELEEVTKHLPTELTIWVNPGEVSYRVGQCGTLMVLYSARDTSNSVLNRLLSATASGRSGTSDIPAAGQLRLAIQDQLMSGTSPMGNQDTISGQGGNDQIQMKSPVGGVFRRNSATGAVFDAAPGGVVEPSSPSGQSIGLNVAASPSFELSSPNDLKFTVGSFAMTRFGTTKLKSTPAAVERSKSPKRRQRTGSDRFKRE